MFIIFATGEKVVYNSDEKWAGTDSTEVGRTGTEGGSHNQVKQTQAKHYT